MPSSKLEARLDSNDGQGAVKAPGKPSIPTSEPVRGTEAVIRIKQSFMRTKVEVRLGPKTTRISRTVRLNAVPIRGPDST